MSEFSRRGLIGFAAFGFGASAGGLGARLVSGTSQGPSRGGPSPQDHHNTLYATDFGARGDGIADDTGPLVALFSAMQETGKWGMLGDDGANTRYLIDCGALEWTFNNDPIASAPGPAGPTLLTKGKVTLVAKPGSADAAFLSIHNDPNAGSRFVHGGHIGALAFEDTTSDVAPNRHGIELYGVEAMSFDPIFSENLQGDLVHIKQMGATLTGDAWHVSQCTFEGLTGWPGVKGWALNNDSLSQFFNFNHIGMIWRIANPTKPGLGAWRGAGAGNVCERMSVLGTSGWAVDWATANSSTQVATITNCHLDGPEYGIHIDGPQLVHLGGVRIVHRYMEAGVQNDATSSWPKIVCKIGGGGFSSQDIEARFYNYYKEGITSGNPGLPASHAIEDKLGVLTDLGNDPTVRRLKIDHSLSYVIAALGVPLDRYLTNMNPNATNISLKVDGAPVVATLNRNRVIARASAGTLRSAGFTAVTFDSIQVDESGCWGRGNGIYTCKAKGLHRVRFQVTVKASAGETVRLVLGYDPGGDGAPVFVREETRVTSGGEETFRLETEYPCNIGDKLAFFGRITTADEAFTGGSVGVHSNNYVMIEVVD